ncbi:MAG: C-terminal binding protein [Desulfobacterales bacterium]|nr:C-terminal binding protein [Desulfobacterales bacterium]
MEKAKMNILIPDRLKKDEIEFEQKILGDRYCIKAPCAKTALEIDDLIWKETDAILAWHELQYTREIINKLDRCKIIVRVGVGFDNVDLAAAGEKGILVCNVPDYGTNDVADHAIAMLLSFQRGILSYNQGVKKKHTWGWTDAGPLKRVYGSVLGIIGMGRIGTATAMRAKAFGMQVHYYDPYIPDGMDKALDVKKVDDLSELIKCSDVISLHTPLTDETSGMVNASFLKSMKKDSILINTARGEVIDFDALYDALKNSEIRAAGLDVLPIEPPDPKHPLIKEWRDSESWLEGRLLITPHSAFFNREAYEELRCKSAIVAKNYFEGKTPKNIVNKNYLK